jgi:hypothetical protein
MNVRCAKCGQVWFHALLLEPEAQPPSIALTKEPPPLPASAEVAEAVETRAEAPAPVAARADLPPEPKSEVADPAARHPTFEHAVVTGAERDSSLVPGTEIVPPPSKWRRRGANAVRFVAWIALLFIVLWGAWATIAYRQPIVEAWPRAGSFYAAIGMPVDINGLALQDFTYTNEFEGGVPVLLITGKVVNASTRELPVPPVHISLTDAERRELAAWNVNVGTPTLAPGESRNIETRRLNPPDARRNLDVRFLQPDETP